MTLPTPPQHLADRDAVHETLEALHTALVRSWALSIVLIEQTRDHGMDALAQHASTDIEDAVMAIDRMQRALDRPSSHSTIAGDRLP